MCASIADIHSVTAEITRGKRRRRRRRTTTTTTTTTNDRM